MTPTTLSLRQLAAEGWLAGIVERRVASVSHDLFGFIDVVAIRPGETLAVQCTSRDHISHRARKIAESPNIGAVREAGWRIEIHGWDHRNGADRLRIVDVS